MVSVEGQAINYSPHRSALDAISGLMLGAELGVQGVPRSMSAPLDLGDFRSAFSTTWRWDSAPTFRQMTLGCAGIRVGDA